MAEVLARVPWPSLLACFELQVAPGHVEAGRITEDEIERIGLTHFRARFADGNDQFGFEMIARSLGRIGDGRAVGHQIVSPFGEKERRLAVGVRPHFARVRLVIAADADNAANGKGVCRPRNRSGRAFGEREDVGHLVILAW